MQNKGIALCCTTQFTENLFVLFSIYFLMYLYIYNKSVRLFLVLFILYVIHIMAGNNCVIMMYRIMHYVSTTNINTHSPNRLIQRCILSIFLTLLRYIGTTQLFFLISNVKAKVISNIAYNDFENQHRLTTVPLLLRESLMVTINANYSSGISNLLS